MCYERLLARDYRASHCARISKVIDLTESLLDAHANNEDQLVFHEARATALYEMKKYEAALPSLRYVLSRKGTKSSNACFKMARTASGIVLSGAAQKEFWISCSTDECKYFHLAYKEALEGQFDQAKVSFNVAHGDLRAAVIHVIFKFFISGSF